MTIKEILCPRLNSYLESYYHKSPFRSEVFIMFDNGEHPWGILGCDYYSKGNCGIKKRDGQTTPITPCLYAEGWKKFPKQKTNQ